ncbi:sensor histidine kinase [Hymenobacter sp. BT730]|uniref:sensor histidine kinase n=1 Tax=Hymenobacter sp. BT730 TaxID=3063332 RepID=UPI0026E08C40|nr:histidine kinase [Hymenobacter sp. BT730]
MRRNLWFYLLALGLALLLTLSGSLRGASTADHFIWHPDAPVWLLLQIMAITALLDWLRRRRPPLEAVGIGYFLQLLLLGSVLWLASTELLEFVIRLLPGTRPHDWGWYALLRSVLLGLMDFLLIGGLYLGFVYQHHLAAARTAVAQAEQAASRARLLALQQHVDPHFLFNNLNILAALIEPGNHPAQNYLTHLASLYRYLVRTRKHEAVPVGEELAFARDYQFLLTCRFGKAYEFTEEMQVGAEELATRLVPPGVLQELLTNAVKHNLASRAHPLRVRVLVTPTALTVHNDRRPRPTPAAGEGSGLTALRSRLALLADVPVHIDDTPAYFAVTLPLTPVLAPPTDASAPAGR